MLGAWLSAVDLVKGESIPVCCKSWQVESWTHPDAQTYYFARDDRVYKAFVERLELHKGAIQRTLSRRLRWQLRILAKVLEGRNTTYRVCVQLNLYYVFTCH
jgi:hypothetical protein